MYIDVPIDKINIEENEIKLLINMLNNSEVTIFNSKTLKEFENYFCEFLGKGIKGLFFPNCTSALFVGLKLFNLKDNYEVIIPNLTHPSVMSALSLNGLKVKICDFEENSYNLDLNHLESLITLNTKVVIISYLHGYSTNILEVKKICDKYGIKIIEDVAQGLGVIIKDKKAGTIGEIGCFSFGANKLLKMGEGGMITFKKDYSNLIDIYRHVGEVWKSSQLSTISYNSTYKDILENGFDYIEEGFNFRTNPLHLALSITQLKKIDETIKIRQQKLSIYFEILKDVEGVNFINNDISGSAPISSWIVLDKKYKINKVITNLLKRGIVVGKFKYKTLNNIPLYKKYILNYHHQFNNSQFINQQSLFLPLYETITFDTIKEIALTLKEVLKNYQYLEEDEKFLNQQIKYFNGFFLKW